MTYYDDLENDTKRVEAFKKAINSQVHGIVYDLGTGSGILSKFASPKSEHVYAVEQNPLIVRKLTSLNLENYSNVTILVDDAITCSFKHKPDVIICEMLDTALIDEEQALVINNSHKYKKDDTIYIPEAITNTIQLINTNVAHITYNEDGHPKINNLSDEVEYMKVEFKENINLDVDMNINITPKKAGLLNAIKITTYTHLTQKLTIPPTPMLNPPLIIPLNHTKEIKPNKELTINLKYKMGGGLNTIHADIR